MKAIISLTLFILLLMPAYALDTVAEDSTRDITLVDVSADGQSCIFNVYGKTVVVDRRDTATVNGVTIYVQEVYPVNSEAQDTDRCKFMYSGAVQTETDEETETDSIQEMTIGEKVVQFLLGKRDEAEAQNNESEEIGVEEQTTKEPPEETTVKVGGYDVTAKQEPAPEIMQQEEQELTFFQKLKRFLFG